MAMASLERHTPVEQLFIGPYATSSLEYIQSLERAAIPLIYSQVIVVFSMFYAVHNPPPFIPGGPVTVTIGRFGPYMRGMGYAFYGMVKEFVRSSGTSRDVVHLQIVVELHTIPGHFMQWERLDLQLWALPPNFIRFIQPHAFLDPKYQHKPYDKSKIPTIHMFHGITNHAQWMRECYYHCLSFNMTWQFLVPPPLPTGAYPHYPSNSTDIKFETIRLLRTPRSSMDYEWKDLYFGSAIVAWDAAVVTLMKYGENETRSLDDLAWSIRQAIFEYIKDDSDDNSTL